MALTVIVRDVTPVRVVLPPKRDQVVGHVDDAVIRDGDAVRIAREVVQDVGRPTKGWFGIDDPILAEERAEEGAKSALRRPGAGGRPDTSACRVEKRALGQRQTFRETLCSAP